MTPHEQERRGKHSSSPILLARRRYHKSKNVTILVFTVAKLLVGDLTVLKLLSRLIKTKVTLKERRLLSLVRPSSIKSLRCHNLSYQQSQANELANSYSFFAKTF